MDLRKRPGNWRKRPFCFWDVTMNVSGHYTGAELSDLPGPDLCGRFARQRHHDEPLRHPDRSAAAKACLGTGSCRCQTESQRRHQHPAFLPAGCGLLRTALHRMGSGAPYRNRLAGDPDRPVLPAVCGCQTGRNPAAVTDLGEHHDPDLSRCAAYTAVCL